MTDDDRFQRFGKIEPRVEEPDGGEPDPFRPPPDRSPPLQIDERDASADVARQAAREDAAQAKLAAAAAEREALVARITAEYGDDVRIKVLEPGDVAKLKRDRLAMYGAAIVVGSLILLVKYLTGC